MSRRDQIKMSEEEAAAFLAAERTLTCATVGVRGWPHLMPLWYVLRESPDRDSSPPGRAGLQIWAWTYAASQKVRNLERDARATLQVEAGEQYQELRGVMLECDVQIHRDVATIAALGNEIFRRYAVPRGQEPVQELPGEVAAMVDKQAVKRVALQFVERRRASWDHRKLAGVY
ncbi:MAG TPA: pyridoxamine 5'-phosphate oxidase family protein [Solirubrobacteraceae bacterium]|nr:pyridoxamine 5'-phosphate oxidase family protein [Solirubrobacteraceae bacterium]